MSPDSRSLAVVLSNDSTEFGSATNFTLSMGDEAFVKNGVVTANTPMWPMSVKMVQPDTIDIVQLSRLKQTNCRKHSRFRAP